MMRVRGVRGLRGAAAATVAWCVLALPAEAIEEPPARKTGTEDEGGIWGEEDLAERAKRMRRGAGIRVGAWNVRDLPEPEGAETSQSPSFLGYFQKGLDLHLALESTMGLWRTSQSIEEESGGIGGGTTREEIQTYVLPVFSAIKLYPVTRPDDRAEPYVNAGVGFVLGIEDRQGSSSNLLGVGAGDGTFFTTGFGFKTGLGLDWKLSRAFGLSTGGQYQWVRFGQEMAGLRTFKGWGFDAGLTYRFQYE